MQVDIYVREKNGSREIRFPILPEQITYESGDAVFVTYDIMNRGSVAVPTGVELAKIGWESDFPGEGRQNDPGLRGAWKEPKHYHSILEDWKKNLTTLTILVVGYPFNFDVYLSKYSAEASGAFGDIVYKLEFAEARDITISAVKMEEIVLPSSRPKTESTTYTIKSGDTLWDIAAMPKHYGDGTKWERIYNANVDIIEATAKKHGKSSSNRGWWIYSGVTLKIPK